MQQGRIYLDFNASTPVAPEVSRAMEQVLHEPFGNPSSEHWAGRSAADAALGRVSVFGPSITDRGCWSGQLRFCALVQYGSILGNPAQASTLATIAAKLEVRVVRYSFPAGLFHSLVGDYPRAIALLNSLPLTGV